MKDPVSTIIVHATFVIVAAGLGWLLMMGAGFGCAVGDPPYGQDCANVSLGLIWLKAMLAVLVAIYAPWGAIWLSIKSVRAFRG